MPATLLFANAAEALAFFQTPPAAPASPPAADIAPTAGATAPASPATDPAPSAPEATKPGALARLFAGGQLADVQGQLATALTEANTLRAELAAAHATNATLLEAVNLAANRIAAQPAQVAAQVGDIAASLGLPAATLPSAETATPPASTAGEGILAQYEAIKDETDRRAFYKANKAKIQAAHAAKPSE